jgi:hypothetical protein
MVPLCFRRTESLKTAPEKMVKENNETVWSYEHRLLAVCGMFPPFLLFFTLSQ